MKLAVTPLVLTPFGPLPSPLGEVQAAEEALHRDALPHAVDDLRHSQVVVYALPKYRSGLAEGALNEPA